MCEPQRGVEFPSCLPALCSVAWRSSNTLSAVVMVPGDCDHGFGYLREPSMRLPSLSLLLVSAVLLGEMRAASAQSPTSYPWCSRGGDGDNYNICYFTSKEQCRATTTGVAAFCFANPYYQPPPPATDEAVNTPSPGWRAVQIPKEPSRQVGARQSRAVRTKTSASTRERSPGGLPKQETLTGADVGIRLPAALTPELPGPGIRPPAAPELSSPKTPE
jgi:hypothetical protein